MAYPTLNTNELFSALYNQIISQTVFADNIKGTFSRLVDEARTDGSLFGDSKIYVSTDVLGSTEWGMDSATATNVLEVHRPGNPDTQVITLDKFREIAVTVDSYISKRAWGTEGAFNEFNSSMLQWIRSTKRIYDSTLYNSFIGTEVSDQKAGARQKEAQNRTIHIADASKEAQQIAMEIADLLVEMSDVSRDFNDYGNLRSYDESEIKVIWNTNFLNKIKLVDLPSIFHKDFVPKLGDYKLPARFFGEVIETASAKNGGKGDGTTIRSLVEKDYNPEGTKRSDKGYKKELHIFPGDLVPKGEAFADNEAYTEDANIICKVVTKLPPYMSSMEVGTSWYNPRNLSENHYLHFGYNTLAHLKNYPMITVKKA